MTLVNKIIKFNKEQSLEYCYNFDFRKLNVIYSPLYTIFIFIYLHSIYRNRPCEAKIISATTQNFQNQQLCRRREQCAIVSKALGFGK